MRNINELRGRRPRYSLILLVLLALAALSFAVLQIPDIQMRVRWRVDLALTYLRGVFNPIAPLPTALAVNLPPPSPQLSAQASLPSATPTSLATAAPPTPTLAVSPTPTLTPTAIPAKAILPAPAYEKQEPNNCGPATLSHYLRFYNWKGDQNTIAAKIKPLPEDRNVNVEELVYFARNFAGWLKTEYRVGGDEALIKKLVAAGVPVMVEAGSRNERVFFPNDDRWSGHYLFINGYDDGLKTFMTQDSWLGPNRPVLYSDLDKDWQAFNRVYILIYPSEKEPAVRSILGGNWDIPTNRQQALEQSKSETEKNPDNAFAWFNLGTNLTYFEQYWEAARAFDKARQIGLPMRMLRYQFGPFISYFHSGRTEDLVALTEYALQLTPNSEETMIWRGWALYRLGKKQEALDLFMKALEVHPNYEDALYALSFVQKN